LNRGGLKTPSKAQYLRCKPLQNAHIIKGWVMVASDGFNSDDELKDWLNKAKDFVNTLPPK
jgi:hypothetical protein